jgi:hypothetical protein
MEDMGNLYEEKVFVPKDTFKVQVEKKPKKAEADKKAFISSPSGPAEADGFNKEIIDPKTAKNDNFYEPKKFSQNCEKTETKTINNFMNKSIFDKLYEDVMSDRVDDMASDDLDALGLPGDKPAAEGEAGEVTITLDKELAQKLHDVLMAVLEDGETEGEMEGEPEAEGESAENVGDDADEQNETFGEATDLEHLPDSKGAALQSKNNKVGDVTSSLKSSGEGDGTVTAEVDGKGKDLPHSKGASLQSKNNKVASKTSKVGAYLAGLK